MGTWVKLSLTVLMIVAVTLTTCANLGKIKVIVLWIIVMMILMMILETTKSTMKVMSAKVVARDVRNMVNVVHMLVIRFVLDNQSTEFRSSYTCPRHRKDFKLFSN